LNARMRVPSPAASTMARFGRPTTAEVSVIKMFSLSGA
jgi:hypothetical protein